MVCCITYMTSILYWLNQSNLFSLLILMGGSRHRKIRLPWFSFACHHLQLHGIHAIFYAIYGWMMICGRERRHDFDGPIQGSVLWGKRLISGSMTATKKGTQSEVLEVENGKDRTEQFSLCCEYAGTGSKWPATPWLSFGNWQYAYVHIQVRSKLLWPLLGNMKCAPVSLAVKKGK